jgi:hypothetical protein
MWCAVFCCITEIYPSQLHSCGTSAQRRSASNSISRCGTSAQRRSASNSISRWPRSYRVCRHRIDFSLCIFFCLQTMALFKLIKCDPVVTSRAASFYRTKFIGEKNAVLEQNGRGIGPVLHFHLQWRCSGPRVRLHLTKNILTTTTLSLILLALLRFSDERCILGNHESLCWPSGGLIIAGCISQWSNLFVFLLL